MSTRTLGISLVWVLMAVLSAIPVYGGLRSAVDPETGSLLSVDGSFELGAGSLVLLHRGPQDADFEEREVALSNVSRKPEIQQVVYTASMKEFVVFFTATGDGADTKLFVLKVDAKTGEPRGNPIEVPIRQDDGTVIRTSSAWHGAMEAWFIAYQIRTPLAATRVGEGGAPPTSEIRVERTDAGFRSARDPWSVLEHRNPAIQVHRGGKVRVVSNNNNVVTAFDLDVESLEELGRSDTSPSADIYKPR